MERDLGAEAQIPASLPSFPDFFLGDIVLKRCIILDLRDWTM